MSLTLSQINVFPVKSLLGFSPKKWPISSSGLQYDRQWMIVEKDGKFLTQRNTPLMTQIRAKIEGNNLILTQKTSHLSITVGIDERANNKISVTIWGQHLDASKVSQKVDEWLSDQLNRDCHLVTIPSGFRRSQSYTGESLQINFNDKYPILIASSESLHSLNQMIGRELPMDRFRPNLIITGGNGTEEEENDAVTIGDILIKLSQPCKRCRIICTDQGTGDVQMEILSEVKKAKSFENSPVFGINAIPRHSGIVKINSEVTF